jgi:hypothetical protein
MVEAYVKSCAICQTTNSFKTRDEIKPIRTYGVWVHVQMDLVNFIKFKDSNHAMQHCLTIVDSFSKFAFAFALQDKTAETVAAYLLPLFMTEGPPQVHTQSTIYLSATYKYK